MATIRFLFLTLLAVWFAACDQGKRNAAPIAPPIPIYTGPLVLELHVGDVISFRLPLKITEGQKIRFISSNEDAIKISMEEHMGLIDTSDDDAIGYRIEALAVPDPDKTHAIYAKYGDYHLFVIQTEFLSSTMRKRNPADVFLNYVSQRIMQQLSFIREIEADFSIELTGKPIPRALPPGASPTPMAVTTQTPTASPEPEVFHPEKVDPKILTVDEVINGFVLGSYSAEDVKITLQERYILKPGLDGSAPSWDEALARLKRGIPYDRVLIERPVPNFTASNLAGLLEEHKNGIKTTSQIESLLKNQYELLTRINSSQMTWEKALIALKMGIPQEKILKHKVEGTATSANTTTNKEDSGAAPSPILDFANIGNIASNIHLLTADDPDLALFLNFLAQQAKPTQNSPTTQSRRTNIDDDLTLSCPIFNYGLDASTASTLLAQAFEGDEDADSSIKEVRMAFKDACGLEAASILGNLFKTRTQDTWPKELQTLIIDDRNAGHVNAAHDFLWLVIDKLDIRKATIDNKTELVSKKQAFLSEVFKAQHLAPGYEGLQLMADPLFISDLVHYFIARSQAEDLILARNNLEAGLRRMHAWTRISGDVSTFLFNNALACNTFNTKAIPAKDLCLTKFGDMFIFDMKALAQFHKLGYLVPAPDKIQYPDWAYVLMDMLASRSLEKMVANMSYFSNDEAVEKANSTIHAFLQESAAMGIDLGYVDIDRAALKVAWDNISIFRDLVAYWNLSEEQMRGTEQMMPFTWTMMGYTDNSFIGETLYKVGDNEVYFLGHTRIPQLPQKIKVIRGQGNRLLFNQANSPAARQKVMQDDDAWRFSIGFYVDPMN